MNTQFLRYVSEIYFCTSGSSVSDAGARPVALGTLSLDEDVQRVLLGFPVPSYSCPPGVEVTDGQKYQGIINNPTGSEQPREIAEV